MAGPNGELLNPGVTDFIANAGGGWNVNRSARGDFDFGLDDIFVPVALARGDVARKSKARERGHRDIVRAANSGFEHAAAPHRDRVRAASVFDALRFAVSADPAKLDIDNAAGFQLYSGQSMPGIVDAFIEANRGLKLGLQSGMCVDVVPGERLLDHQ